MARVFINGWFSIHGRMFLSILLLFMVVSPVFSYDFQKDGIYYYKIGNTAVKVTYYSNSYGGYSGNVVIPETVEYQNNSYSVTSIGSSAFYGCSGLTSVTIPNSVTSIDDYAFYGCRGLTSVTIGNGVTSIGDYAFRYCGSLKSVTIPNRVTSIGEEAFKGCSGLTSVTIGESVTFIGNQAFSGCYGLTSVTIPNSVTSIGGGAFEGCSGLTSVTIPNGVGSISWSTFAWCSGLTSVTIGNGVTSIGSGAFAGCSGLTSVISLNTTPPQIDNSTFSDETYKSATLIVPVGCKNIYWLQPYWENFANISEIDVSGIKQVQMSDGDVIVVNLRGERMKIKSNQINTLPKDIYIVNGKKYLVK